MQQLFLLLIFLNQPYMFRATISSILTSTFSTVYVYTVKKCSWGWAKLSPEICRANLKKFNKRKRCCILLVAYIIVLEMFGHTNINFTTSNFISVWFILLLLSHLHLGLPSDVFSADFWPQIVHIFLLSKAYYLPSVPYINGTSIVYKWVIYFEQVTRKIIYVLS